MRRFSYGRGCFTQFGEVCPGSKDYRTGFPFEEFRGRCKNGSCVRFSQLPLFGGYCLAGRRALGGRAEGFGRLRAAERAGDGREHGVGWLELGFVPVGGPAIGRNAGGDKKEQS